MFLFVPDAAFQRTNPWKIHASKRSTGYGCLEILLEFAGRRGKPLDDILWR